MFQLSDGNLLISFIDPYFSAPQEGDDPNLMIVSQINKSGEFMEQNLLQFTVPFPTDQRLVYLGSGMSVFSDVTFYPDVRMAMDPEEHIHIGKSDSLVIRQYDKHGEFINILQETYTPARLADNYLDSLYDSRGDLFRRAVSEAGRPDNWPVFQDFLLDDEGRCWVQLINPGNSQQTWHVFNRDGRVKWKFALPAEVNLYEIKEGKAYGISQPEDDISAIIRYDIKEFRSDINKTE